MRLKGSRLAIKNVNDYVRICGLHGHPAADKRGTALEHRKVMVEHIGRALKTNEYVHHKNGDPKDNRIENLEILSPSDHSKLHAKVQVTVSLVCTYCDKGFKRFIRNYNHKKAQGQINFYCGRRCSGKHITSKGYSRNY